MDTKDTGKSEESGAAESEVKAGSDKSDTSDGDGKGSKVVQAGVSGGGGKKKKKRRRKKK